MPSDPAWKSALSASSRSRNVKNCDMLTQYVARCSCLARYAWSPAGGSGGSSVSSPRRRRMQHGFNVVPFGARAKSYRRGNRLHWLEKIVLAFVASVAVIGFASSSATAVSGDLFVSNLEVNDVLEYNGTTGAFVGVFASGSGLSAPAGLVFGPNGNLFVTSSNSNEVLEYDGTTGAFITTFASGGGLRGPQDLTFGPNGDLFVTSVVTNEVLEYNGTTGAFVTSFASTGGAGLHDPTGLAFGPNGDLFVASYLTNQILEYNGVTGAYVRTFKIGRASCRE